MGDNYKHLSSEMGKTKSITIGRVFNFHLFGCNCWSSENKKDEIFLIKNSVLVFFITILILIKNKTCIVSSIFFFRNLFVNGEW